MATAIQSNAKPCARLDRKLLSVATDGQLSPSQGLLAWSFTQVSFGAVHQQKSRFKHGEYLRRSFLTPLVSFTRGSPICRRRFILLFFIDNGPRDRSIRFSYPISTLLSFNPFALGGEAVDPASTSLDVLNQKPNVANATRVIVNR